MCIRDRQYTINKVSFITDYNVLQASTQNSIEVNDSLHYKGFPIYYKDKLYLRTNVLTNNLRMTPGTLYNEQNAVSYTHLDVYKRQTPNFLAWTTTPWTLPSNTALCVGPKIDYVAVQTYLSLIHISIAA